MLFSALVMPIHHKERTPLQRGSMRYPVYQRQKMTIATRALQQHAWSSMLAQPCHSTTRQTPACQRHAVTDDTDARQHTAHTPGGCHRVDCRGMTINPRATAAAPISSFEECLRLREAHAHGVQPMAAYSHARRSLPQLACSARQDSHPE